jgi:hypothetical protein
MPLPTFSADWPAGTSACPQVDGDAPSVWVRNPKRWVFWFDQSTPILPFIETTSAMSSTSIPVPTTTGPEKEV